MNRPPYKTKHMPHSIKSWHRVLCVILIFAIFATIYPANAFTSLAQAAGDAAVQSKEDGKKIKADEDTSPVASDKEPGEAKAPSEDRTPPGDDDKSTDGESDRDDETPPDDGAPPEGDGEGSGGESDGDGEAPSEGETQPEEEHHEDSEGAANADGETPPEEDEENGEDGENGKEAASGPASGEKPGEPGINTEKKPGKTVYKNSIGGALWLDVLEDGEGGDGIRSKEAPPLPGFDVSLYESDDREAPVATVQTDDDGKYIFKNIEPGLYVVGISTDPVDQNDRDNADDANAAATSDQAEPDGADENDADKSGEADEHDQDESDKPDEPAPADADKSDVDESDQDDADPEEEVAYLLPVAGITKDNKFADFNEDRTAVFTEEIDIEADTVVARIDAGLRVEAEKTVYKNSIGGALWLDVLEDREGGDGIRSKEAPPLPDFDVSLYQSDDREAPVATVQTDDDGKYIFKNIEPGLYVVGISTVTADQDDTDDADASSQNEADDADQDDADPEEEVAYLLPAAGLTDDNKFADFNEDRTTVFTEALDIEANTVVKHIDAGMRVNMEQTVYANSISGALWLDVFESGNTPGSPWLNIFEDSSGIGSLQPYLFGSKSGPGSLWLDVPENKDENSRAFNGDGIRQAEEQPLPGFEVSLYQSDDRETPVATVQTDGGGEYLFENIEPGLYVVGLSAVLAGSGGPATADEAYDPTDYLLPAIGLTEDNKFADFSPDRTTVFSEEFEVEADTVVTGMDGGIRTPPGIMPLDLPNGYVVRRNADNYLYGTKNSLNEAVALCPANIPCTITLMGDDLTMGTEASLADGKNITLKSNGNNKYTIKKQGAGRHFNMAGTNTILHLENIILDGNRPLNPSSAADTFYGGLQVNSGTVILTNSTVQNCYASSGGGGILLVGTVAHATLNPGTVIQNCYANSNGGGISVMIFSNLTIDGASFIGNYAKDDGGAIHYGGTQTANPVNTTTSFRNLHITNSTFSGNTTAGSKLIPPINAEQFTNRASKPFPGDLLNNDDINYKAAFYGLKLHNPDDGEIKYFQTTVAVGSSESFALPIATDANVGFIAPAVNQVYDGWSAQPTGGATVTSVTVGPTSNKEFYARWKSQRYLVYLTSDLSSYPTTPLPAPRGLSNDLATAVGYCTLANPYTIIATSSDTLSGAVTIPVGKDITLKSDGNNAGGANWVITQDAQQRHFSVSGKLTLENITLKGLSLKGSTYNGGVFVSGAPGSLTMNDGAIIDACNNYYGGGVSLGGADATFTMNGGKICDNMAAHGGGVYLAGPNSSLTMSGNAEITENTATQNGGGVYLADGDSILGMTGGAISSNKAPDGNGGGIYTENYDYANPISNVDTAYSNISISGGATVSGNTAKDGPLMLPVNHVQFTNRTLNPFSGTLLDNEQINYRGGAYAVTYKVNNGTGVPDAYQPTIVTLGSTGTATLFTQAQAGFNVAAALKPGQEKLSKWQVEGNPNTTYDPGQANVPISDNLTLVALWTNERYIVTKPNATGGTDTVSSHHLLADAVTACTDNGVAYTITATEDDDSMGSQVSIPADKIITLTSGGTRRTITQAANVGNRHFSVEGSLTLDNIVLAGKGLTGDNPSYTNGGVEVTGGGRLTMKTDAEITKCFSLYGGGVRLHDQAKFFMQGGAISDNNTTYRGTVELNDGASFDMEGGDISGNTAGAGGGVYLLGDDSTFTMTNGKISNNEATDVNTGGGGVYVSGQATFTLETGGEISGNEASAYGGGVAVSTPDSVFNMNGGKITGNKAANGGGILMTGKVTLTAGTVSGNTATTNGGGLFTLDSSTTDIADITKYAKLSISDAVQFGDNTSSQYYAPPSNYGDFSDPAKRLTNPLFDGELLDNDNIVYKNPYYVIVYDSNPMDGSPGIKTYQHTMKNSSSAPVEVPTYTLAQSGFAAPANHGLVSWAEQKGGTNAHTPGADILLTGSIKLYAQWAQAVDITISKTVDKTTGDGQYGSLNKDFEFVVTITEPDGSSPTGSKPVVDTFTCVGDVTAGTGAALPGITSLTTDANGEATFTLSHGQKLTLKELPVNYSIQIRETSDPEYETKYLDSLSGAATPTPGNTVGPIPLSGGTRTIAFTNTYTNFTPPTGISMPSHGSALLLTLSLSAIGGTPVLRHLRRRKGGDRK